MQTKNQGRARIGALLFDKPSTVFLAKYSNYNNFFLVENAAKFLNNSGINNYIIKLEKNKQSLFNLIYSLKLVELEALKTYIKTNLANNFIQSFKSSANTPILFDQKPDRSLRLCVDY